MKTVQAYWGLHDAYKKQHGQYLPQVFDFISMHKKLGMDCPYSLISPLCLCDSNGKRPEFENEVFKTKSAMLKRAKELARIHKVKLVDCTKL